MKFFQNANNNNCKKNIHIFTEPKASVKFTKKDGAFEIAYTFCNNLYV